MGLKIGKKIVQSDIAKDVGREMRDTAIRSAINTTTDALEGKNVNESLQSQLDSAKRQIASTIKRAASKKKKDKLSKVKPSTPRKKKNIRKKSSSFFLDN